MYEIEIERMFSAAHRLRDYDGSCALLHGHNYAVCVALRADELDALGMAFDYKKLKAALDDILLLYDHAYLNDLKDFAELNPTSENLARVIFDKISLVVGDGRVRVFRVTIRESDSSSCSYFGE